MNLSDNNSDDLKNGVINASPADDIAASSDENATNSETIAQSTQQTKNDNSSDAGQEPSEEMTRIDDVSPESAPEASGDSTKDHSPSSAIADCWEDAVDSGKLGSPFKTNNQQKNAPSDKDEVIPDEEEKEDILSDLEKITIRKKPAAPAAIVKKEHVNLVIIGHVGKCK